MADESVDFRIVSALRAARADVYSILEQNPSTDDVNVLQIATNRDCLLLTEDKDFGDLIFRTRLPHKGVFLLRIPNKFPEDFPVIAAMIVHHYDSLINAFSVYNGVKLRIRY